MSKTLCAIATALAMLASEQAASAEELVVKGTYQGENIYVKNPFAPSGVGFCAYEVTVNGTITTDEINSSAFEIDLSIYETDSDNFCHNFTKTAKLHGGCLSLKL